MRGRGGSPWKRTSSSGGQRSWPARRAAARRRPGHADGPGGVGKTRVALRAAAAADAAIPAAPGRSAVRAARPRAAAAHRRRVLGLPEQPPLASQRDALLAHLRDRRLLLVLDTCEHLIDACADLAEAILTAAPQVTVLATSREPLDVAGETTSLRPSRRLRPAPDDDDARRQGPATPSSCSRGGRPPPRPGSPSPREPGRRDPALPAARRHTARHRARRRPAAHAPLTSSPTADQRLDRRLPLLTGGNDGGDDRHRTLRDAIGWSYDLCTPPSARCGRGCRCSPAPSASPPPRRSARAASSARDEIFETIIRLVDKSVLVTLRRRRGRRPAARGTGCSTPSTSSATSSSPRRARDRGPRPVHRPLPGHGTVLRRASATGDDQLELFRELRREHTNIRAALEYTLDARAARAGPRGRGARHRACTATGTSSGLLPRGPVLARQGRSTGARRAPERGWALVSRCYLGAMQGDGRRGGGGRGAPAPRSASSSATSRLIGRGYSYLMLALTRSPATWPPRRRRGEGGAELDAVGDRDGLAILDVHRAHAVPSRRQTRSDAGYYARGLAPVRRRPASEWMYRLGYCDLRGCVGYLETRAGTPRPRAAAQQALLAKYELGRGHGHGLLPGDLRLAGRPGRPPRAGRLAARRGGPAVGPAGGRLGGTAAPWSSGTPRRRPRPAPRSARRPSPRCSPAAAGTRSTRWSRSRSTTPTRQAARFPPRPAGPGKLTDREWEIAFLAAAGLSAEQIARQLFLPTRRSRITWRACSASSA